MLKRSDLKNHIYGDLHYVEPVAIYENTRVSLTQKQTDILTFIMRAPEWHVAPQDIVVAGHAGSADIAKGHIYQIREVFKKAVGIDIIFPERDTQHSRPSSYMLDLKGPRTIETPTHLTVSPLSVIKSGWFYKGSHMYLRPIPHQILTLLAQACGGTVTHQEIMDKTSIAKETCIKVHINSLRETFHAVTSAELILTKAHNAAHQPKAGNFAGYALNMAALYPDVA